MESHATFFRIQHTTYKYETHQSAQPVLHIHNCKRNSQIRTINIRLLCQTQHTSFIPDTKYPE
jgi:hypothetical protein